MKEPRHVVSEAEQEGWPALDVELAERLAEVVVDRARADEE
jgi:hypothetical protein